MCINKYHMQKPYPKDIDMNITVDGTLVKQVSKFIYLGSMLTCDGSIND